jgi:hypothetical protein
MYDFWQDEIGCELRSLAQAEGWDQLSPKDQVLRAGSVEQQVVGAAARPEAQLRCWRITVRRLLPGRWGKQRAALAETAATGGGTIV